MDGLSVVGPSSVDAVDGGVKEMGLPHRVHDGRKGGVVAELVAVEAVLQQPEAVQQRVLEGPVRGQDDGEDAAGAKVH